MPKPKDKIKPFEIKWLHPKRNQYYINRFDTYNKALRRFNKLIEFDASPRWTKQAFSELENGPK